MTDTDERDPNDRDYATPKAVRDSDPMIDQLRHALGSPPGPRRSLLPKIQDRIRVRTRGRYFRDRYSQSTDPVPLILLMALFVLVISAAVYLVFKPLVDQPEPVKLQKAPQDPMATPE